MLDNCEHLLDPAARLVDASLRARPGVRVLATSREALDVDGEQAVRLRSMAVADVRRARRGRRQRRGAAVRRPRRGRAPGFALDRRTPPRQHDLPPPRRHPARDRAGGGACRVDEPVGDRRPARRAVPAADRRPPHRAGAPPDAARHGRLVVRAARRPRAGGVRTPRRVRRQLRRRGRVRVVDRRRRRRNGTSSTRSTVSSASRWSSPRSSPTDDPLPDARDAAAVCPRTARRARRDGPVARRARPLLRVVRAGSPRRHPRTRRVRAAGAAGSWNSTTSAAR